MTKNITKKQKSINGLAAGEVFLASDGKVTPTIIIAPSMTEAVKKLDGHSAKMNGRAAIVPVCQNNLFRLSINFCLLEVNADGTSRFSAVVPEGVLRQIQNAPTRPDGQIVLGAMAQTAEAK